MNGYNSLWCNNYPCVLLVFINYNKRFNINLDEARDYMETVVSVHVLRNIPC